MKIRRITVAVLLLLSLLYAADLRYFKSGSSGEPHFHLEIGPTRRPFVPQAERTVSFTRGQGELTSLKIAGLRGAVELTSTEADELKIWAAVKADREETLQAWEVVEEITQGEISYRLVGEGSSGLPEVGVDFRVEVPAGMEVAIEQNFGTVEVADFVGYLKLTTRFSQTRVAGLQGTLEVENQMGSLVLRDLAGPLYLQDSFSTSEVELVEIDGGYSFQIEAANGTIRGNAPLQSEKRQNITTAQGRSGEGIHPVVIKSSFGVVKIDLK